MRLSGASVVVTGGGSGLGLATATRLARGAARVVALDLAFPEGAGRQQPGNVTFSPGDVTVEADVGAALDLAERAGPLRVLVSCAGIGDATKVVGREGPQPLERFVRTVTVNLVGTFNAIRLAAGRMTGNDPVDGDRGVMVTTASVAAFDGQVGQAAYSASKAGVVGMTLPIARELADHQVRVVTVAPGAFRTPLLASLPRPAQESLARQVPHPKRLGDPDEFAALVAHIVENGMLNGEVVRLDGAIRMAPR